MEDNLDEEIIEEEESPKDLVKKLRDKLKTCQKEREEYLTGWQRAKADLINARKRDEEERGNFVKFANERLVSELLPVLQSFEMAFANREAWEKADKNWRTGVEYIHTQLTKALKDNGLSEINPLDQKFDHTNSEASSYEKTDDPKKDHTVLKVLQKGYELNGKIIKPAQVIVGEYKKD